MIAAKIASWDEDDQGRHVLTAATVQQIVEVFALETQRTISLLFFSFLLASFASFPDYYFFVMVSI